MQAIGLCVVWSVFPSIISLIDKCLTTDYALKQLFSLILLNRH